MTFGDLTSDSDDGLPRFRKFFIPAVILQRKTHTCIISAHTASLSRTQQNSMYTVSGKKVATIFDYNSRISWWIFIIFILLKTGVYTDNNI